MKVLVYYCISLLLFLVLGSSFYVSAKSDQQIIDQYKQDFIANGGFPLGINRAIKKIIMQAPYDSIYLYADSKAFVDLLGFDDRNKQDVIAVTWFVVGQRNQSDSFLDKVLGDYLPTSFSSFTGLMRLRGGLSLNCGKPSFKIENNSQHISMKLKSFCGTDYGVEEALFGELIDDMTNILQPYHVFFVQQSYKKVFVNGKLYGIYLEVPTFNTTYLKDSWIVDPDKDRQCIEKMARFLLPKGVYKNIPVTSRLEVNKYPFSDEQVNFTMETKYGDKDTCMQHKRRLLDVINQASPTWDAIKKIAHPESILLRGMILRYTNNHISFTHNYLLVYHDWGYYAGFRDIENFHGCQKQSLEDYFNDDNRQYNKLFGHVLRRYQQNEPQTIAKFTAMIQQRICSKNPYVYFKNNHLPYVMADRYLRNMGNINPVSQLSSQGFVDDFFQTYADKMDFKEFFQKQYDLFDVYFGLKK